MACSVKRAVTEPLGDFLKVHDRLFDLLDSIDKLDCLHSGVRGRSHVSNARTHPRDQPTVKLHIQRFFSSVDVPQLCRFLGRQMACAAPVADPLS